MTAAAAGARSGVQTLTVGENDAGQRLDRWFRRRFPEVRHGELEKLLRTGQVRVEGGRVKASRRLEAGERVRVPPLQAGAPPAPAPHALSAADRAYVRDLVIYEDADVIALNKPFGLPVQGGAKTARHLDGLLPGLAAEGAEPPRLVHRLDRDTGGLILLAKTRVSAAKLAEDFKDRRVAKTYWALTAGAPKPPAGVIDLPLAKAPGPGGRERMAPGGGPEAKSARTSYATLDQAAGRVAWLALRPHTGRTHQLRAHCAALGCPIIGDAKYGGAAAKAAGVAPKLHLFARGLSLAHPRTGAPLSLTAPLIGHMAETWAFFEFDANRADSDFGETEEVPARRKRSRR